MISAVSNAEIASYYGKGFHGKLTASGYIYNKNQLTCASNKYKFGSVLKVINLENKKEVIVVVTDTGSFTKKYGRDIDLSEEAFRRLDKLGKGLLDVKIELVDDSKVFRYKHGGPVFSYNNYVKEEK